jgi:hypothetical protein
MKTKGVARKSEFASIAKKLVASLYPKITKTLRLMKLRHHITLLNVARNAGFAPDCCCQLAMTVCRGHVASLPTPFAPRPSPDLR